MIKVNNHAVVRKLAVRQIKNNRKMNTVIILSILLTCILFTALFSIGGSIIKSFQMETMRQVGGSSMAGAKYVLPEDYEKICSDKAVINPGYRIIVGDVANEMLKNISAEVNFAQDQAAKAMFSYPTKGKMPQKRNEIAMSTLVLDGLGIPHKLGEPVSLDINIDGDIISEEFILCGFWEGDRLAMAQQCFVSREFCDEAAPTPDQSFYSRKDLKYAGYWMVDFDFSNSWNIEQKLDRLMERCGYSDNGNSEIDTGVNWAYVTDSVDMETLLLMGALIFIILFAGYLIIYNVFNINVAVNIRSYGLIKTIGTTGRQLKRIVRYQALIYSAIGIPAGFLLGTLLSKILLPQITESMFQLDTTELSVNILVYIAAALFTLATVFISCQKPCKYAASVTPVEALRYNEVTGKRKEKKTARVSTISMAKTSLSRSRRKTGIVILSLSLSIILLNSVYTMIRGLDADEFVKASIIGDFSITDSSIMKTTSGGELEIAGVEKDDLEYFKSIDGVNSVAEIYCAMSEIKLDEKHYDAVIHFMNKYPDMRIDDYTKTAYEEERVLWCDIYGMNRSAFELAVENADSEKFFAGGYAIVYTYCVDADEDSDEDVFYSARENISVELPDGTVRDYEVMAVQEVPYALTVKAFNTIGAQVIIPDEDLTAHRDEKGALYAVLNTDESKNDLIDAALDGYVNQERSSLIYTSKQSYMDDFRDYINVFWIVGGALCLILAMIGILNFVEVIVTEVFSRQHEFAVMQAVGMTGNQLKTMLIWEGMFYALFTTAFSLIFGSMISKLIVEPYGNQMFCFTWHFTATPVLLCIPVLLLVSFVIPFLAYHAICGGSIVDRLRRTYV